MENKLKLLLSCFLTVIAFGTILQSASAITVPDAPTSLTVEQKGATRNDLSWQFTGNTGGSPVIGYYATRSTDGGTTFVEEPFTSTPQSYWKFDGSTTITDYGSYGNALTYGPSGSPSYMTTSTTGASSMIGPYITLDGSHYLTNSDSRYNIAATGQQFSISFWIQANSEVIGTSNVALITKVSSGAFIGPGWSVWMGGWGAGSTLATLNFNIMDSAGHYIRAYGYPHILDNIPHHVVVTYSGSGTSSGISIYVDKALLATYLNPDTISATTLVSDPLTIGAISTTNTNGLNGALDDIRIFTSVSLNQQQVTDLYSVKASMEQSNVPVVSPASAVANPNTFTFSDNNAIPGAASCYKVFAVNSVGQGAGSTQKCISGNVPPNPPISLAVTNSNGINTLTWVASTNTGTSPLVGYYITRMAASGTATEQPFTSTPLSYWKFDGTISGLKDYGSLSNDLTKQGSGVLSYGTLGLPLNLEGTPSLGNALSLDGNTWLTVPTGDSYSFDNTTPFSVSFWMQANSADIGTNNWPIISKVNSGSFTGQGWSVWMSGWGAGSTLATLNFNLEYNDGNMARVIAYPPRLLDSNPHHVVITYAGNDANAPGMHIFVDGVSQSVTINSRYTTGVSMKNNIPLTIGALSTNTGLVKFKGLLDEVRIFGTDISQQTNAISDLFTFRMTSANTLSIQDATTLSNPLYAVYAVNQDAGEGSRSLLVSLSLTGTAPKISVDPQNPPYYVDHGLFVSITDPSANLRSSTQDVITATVTDTSLTPPTSIDITLTETGPSTGIFDNSRNILVFSSSGQNTPGSSVLGVRAGQTDSIKISYTGANDVNIPVSPLPSGTLPTPISLGSVSTVDCSGDPSHPSVMLSDGLCSYWVDQGSHPNTMAVRANINGQWVEYDYACGGTTGDLCPSTNTNDIYVEYDWMAGHQPDQSAINAVVAAFASRGINLHLIRGDEIPYHDNVTPVHDDGSADVSYDKLKSMYFGTLQERSTLTSAQLTAKSYAFHYALFVHSIKGTTWTGDAGTIGPDIIISLGTVPNLVGSPDLQAGTLMHELGHNLGLRHGGSDDTNCKPNYLSVMSYTRQSSDFIYNRNLDYSGVALPNLDERTQANGGTGLNEGNGIGDVLTGHGTTQGLKTTVGGFDINNVPYTPIIQWTSNYPIDYNRNGVTNSQVFGQNVHYFTNVCPDASLQNLQGFNDWLGLQYRFVSSSTYGAGAPTDKEITNDNLKQIRSDRIQMLKQEVITLP